LRPQRHTARPLNFHVSNASRRIADDLHWNKGLVCRSLPGCTRVPPESTLPRME
jgi:hypothetical protein